MPQINKQFTLEITPERFLEACSAVELHEVQMLLSSPRFQNKMDHRDADSVLQERFCPPPVHALKQDNS